MDSDDDPKTIWCGNLSEKVTQEILYELFLQAGPLKRVSIPKDKEGRQMSYGFVTFKHEVSVQYAIQLFDGTMLYDKPIRLKPRTRTDNSPGILLNSPLTDINTLIQMGAQMKLLQEQHNHQNHNREGSRHFREDRRRDNKPYRDNSRGNNSYNRSHNRNHDHSNYHERNRRHRY